MTDYRARIVQGMKTHPTIIQGGMGVGVSDWKLARAVARLGQLGVVSGTALDQVFARRLQDGDLGGNMRRGLEDFPFRKMAERVWNKYFIPGGKDPVEPYRPLPMHNCDGPVERRELCIVANFVEIALARLGHQNPVGVNYLEKVQIPHLPSLYGALLAGAGYVLMGAGIPLRIPGVLDCLAQHQPASYAVQVAGANKAEDTAVHFTPRDFMEVDLPPLRRPEFLVIIASNTLATTMLKKANGRVDGFVVEGPTAGGHNAPPRGKAPLSEAGEPVYGERDEVDLAKLKALGVPFWLAGGYGTPERLREALAADAAGVQVGTVFALCEESALREDYKRAILASVVAGEAQVFTDPLASPTGFPFKVVVLQGTMAEAAGYAVRPRICDLGYLREAYRLPSGAIGYRCAAEPVATYVAKGGNAEKTTDRKCLCNALLANIGQSQIQPSSYVETGLVTCGNSLADLARFLPNGNPSYSAADVIAKLLGTQA
jgi:nitronate monooxygenase